ncbi:hypothetical protein [Clostridium paraputrificum]|uniref:hypothetical protein n=1 Tax=Clostridium paraputrificum TaxID=29363 RepID=UPI00189CE23A|nr:hypothetical protein [Clostridium paraputrificum]
MIKVVESNTINNKGIKSIQTRIIKVPSWKFIIDIFTEEDNYELYSCRDINGRYEGVIRPKLSKISSLVYDNTKLSCNIILFNKNIVKKTIEKYS